MEFINLGKFFSNRNYNFYDYINENFDKLYNISKVVNKDIRPDSYCSLYNYMESRNKNTLKSRIFDYIYIKYYTKGIKVLDLRDKDGNVIKCLDHIRVELDYENDAIKYKPMSVYYCGVFKLLMLLFTNNILEASENVVSKNIYKDFVALLDEKFGVVGKIDKSLLVTQEDVNVLINKLINPITNMLKDGYIKRDWGFLYYAGYGGTIVENNYVFDSKYNLKDFNSLCNIDKVTLSSSRCYDTNISLEKVDGVDTFKIISSGSADIIIINKKLVQTSLDDVIVKYKELKKLIKEIKEISKVKNKNINIRMQDLTKFKEKIINDTKERVKLIEAYNLILEVFFEHYADKYVKRGSYTVYDDIYKLVIKELTIDTLCFVQQKLNCSYYWGAATNVLVSDMERELSHLTRLKDELLSNSIDMYKSTIKFI